METIAELMPGTGKKRKNASTTLDPELRELFAQFVEACEGVSGLHITGESSAIARIIETARDLGWLQNVEHFKQVHLAALAKPYKPK
jgi:hypothetical protein